MPDISKLGPTVITEAENIAAEEDSLEEVFISRQADLADRKKRITQLDSEVGGILDEVNYYDPKNPKFNISGTSYRKESLNFTDKEIEGVDMQDDFIKGVQDELTSIDSSKVNPASWDHVAENAEMIELRRQLQQAQTALLQYKQNSVILNMGLNSQIDSVEKLLLMTTLKEYDPSNLSKALTKMKLELEALKGVASSL